MQWVSINADILFSMAASFLGAGLPAVALAAKNVPASEPWYKVVAEIIAIPLSAIGLAVSYHLLRKANLESRKLEIGEKERQNYKPYLELRVLKRPELLHSLSMKRTDERSWWCHKVYQGQEFCMNGQNKPDINTLIQQGYSVDIGSFLSRGWEIFKSNFVLFIGFELFTLGVDTALELIPIERIPFVGILSTFASTFIVSVPLYAGELFVGLKIAKGEAIGFGDFFKGFQKTYFSKILLTSLAIGVLIGFCLFWVITGFNLSHIGAILSHLFTSNMSSISTPLLLLTVLQFVAGILGFLGAIYLCVAYFFAIPLVIVLRIAFWQAMETSRKLVNRNWFGIFGLVLILAIICSCGYLLFSLGALLTNPLAICTTIAAYESIIGFPNREAQ